MSWQIALIMNDSQLAVLYLAVEVELVGVLAEPDLGVVDGLKEAVLDQDRNLELLCKVTKLIDGSENHCMKLVDIKMSFLF